MLYLQSKSTDSSERSFMVGEVKNAEGLVFAKDKFNIVKKAGVKGDLIPKHNHAEAYIIFTVVKGAVRVFLNDEEIHDLTPGDILCFDGDNYINVEFLEDGEFFVTLIDK